MDENNMKNLREMKDDDEIFNEENDRYNKN
jgi:hypothetical protein